MIPCLFPEVIPVSDPCAAIIDRLIAERRRRGMTQADLARAASLPQPSIARMESKRTVPQLDTLLRVAAALGCELAVIPIE